MKYISTRDNSKEYSFEQVFIKGLADDGGLFVPKEVKKYNAEQIKALSNLSYQELAKEIIYPFIGDFMTANELSDIVDKSYSVFRKDNVVDLIKLGDTKILELFHGPTAAFKDVGAGFLASCLSRLNANQSSPLIVLVATSGDTGGAVAAAFDELPNVRVVVLFPEGKVSKRQEKQLTCWGNNILSLSVKGTFDDCQKIVKEAFIDSELTNDYRFSSANSINFGRLLPQSVYYAYSSLKHFRAKGVKPNYIIPTGNLGNGLACILARDMGLPIGDIVLTVNENKLIVDYLMGEGWEPKKSIETLANAMDVGNPSNMERLNSLYGDVKNLNKCIRAITVSDNMIKQEIKRSFEKEQLILCPHTATATHAYHHLSVANKENNCLLYTSDAADE